MMATWQEAEVEEGGVVGEDSEDGALEAVLVEPEVDLGEVEEIAREVASRDWGFSMGRGVEKAAEEEETAMERDLDKAAVAEAKLEDGDRFLCLGEAGAPLDVEANDEVGEAALVDAENISEPRLHLVAEGRRRHHDSVGAIEGDDVLAEDDERGAAPSVGQKKGREAPPGGKDAGPGGVFNGEEGDDVGEDIVREVTD